MVTLSSTSTFPIDAFPNPEVFGAAYQQLPRVFLNIFELDPAVPVFEAMNPALDHQRLHHIFHTRPDILEGISEAAGTPRPPVALRSAQPFPWILCIPEQRADNPGPRFQSENKTIQRHLELCVRPTAGSLAGRGARLEATKSRHRRSPRPHDTAGPKCSIDRGGWQARGCGSGGGQRSNPASDTRHCIYAAGAQEIMALLLRQLPLRKKQRDGCGCTGDGTPLERFWYDTQPYALRRHMGVS